MLCLIILEIKKYCTPWKQKVLTYDFQNYSSLGKEKTLNEIENAFCVWQNVCNLKFERVFDASQVMNIAFLTDDEKQVSMAVLLCYGNR